MISRFLPASLHRLLTRKTKSSRPTFDLVEAQAQMRPFLAALDRVDEVALDTEADNMYHYRTRVCLLQFLIGGEVFLVDVLAPGLKLDELWLRLATKHLIMHGSDFDLRLLHDLCRFRAKSLFDTMLAAQLLNRKRIGLAGLLEEHFGVELDKNGQKANWSKRPIAPRLLDYATLDVWYLPDLRDILRKELTKRNRLVWLEQQCRGQIEAGTAGFAPPDENDWRIGRTERLRGHGLGVLHAVWHWRESQAKRLDVPPFKVCSAELLTKLAIAAESDSPSERSVLAGVHLGKRHDRLFPSLEAAVAAGIKRDPRTLPKRPGRDPRHASLTQAEVERMDRIKADRDGIATRLELDPTLIANRAQLAQIARAPDQIDAILLPWQADLLRKLPSLKT